MIVVLLIFLLTNFGDPKSMPLFFIRFANPVIMHFLGDLVMAAAANKHGVDQFLMEKLLVKLGNRSSALLIGFICCSAFFSMWMSNTAAVAMMLTLSKPILDALSSDDPLKKGMVIAIAFGANIGGIGTPIDTPPNAMAYVTGLITIKDMFIAGCLIGLIGLVLMLLGFDTIIPLVL